MKRLWVLLLLGLGIGFVGGGLYPSEDEIGVARRMISIVMVVAAISILCVAMAVGVKQMRKRPDTPR